MGLETPTYVGDLNTANPAATDVKSQGDDHLRNIKTALRNSFPGFAGGVVVAGTNGGAANVYTVTPTTALSSYVSPMVLLFSPTVANTGASTINVSGLGAKTIKTVSGADLTTADLVVGLWYAAIYDGTNFNLFAVTKRYVDGLAFNTALPNQTGNSGKVLGTDGTNASWLTTLDAFTLTGGVTFSGAAKQNVTAVAALDIDVSTAEFFTKSISGNSTFTFSNATASKAQGFALELTISSAAVPTWPASVDWTGGVAPTLGNGVHVLGFITFNGGTAWTGFVGALNRS